MEFLGKIYNTVSQNLPGNPITREYDIHKQTGSAGPGLFWKVFLATKKSTKQEASVWMFDKKSLERFSKRDRELLLETVKRGVSNLTRLRHPKILSVVASLEESRESLAFATEPAIGSLANLLGCHDNLTSEAASSLGGFELFDVEIKYGLLQLTEALAFLHQSGKQLHGNFCPESIVVNRCGSWKLAGMDFCQSNTGSEQCPMFACHTWVESLPPQAQPRLNYLAPEAALSHECTSAADIFSLGQLFYTIYNRGRPLIESVADLSGYKRSVAALKGLRVSALSCVPETARDDVKLALNCDPTVRPDASQFGRIVFFEDSGVSALQFMDNLFQLDNLAKSQFYKGLAQISANLPMRVNLLRIIPQISEEFANPNMIPFVLPTILQISESASEAEFKELILPKLLPVFKLREPVQISMICVQNIKILIEKCPTDDTKNHILPILFRSLDQDFVELQELCLETLPTVAHMLDYNTVKNSVVSKLKTLITGQCSLKIKVSAFMCLGKLLENMDKWFVLDEVLPMLQKVQSREPAILMSVLGIYKVAFSHPKLGITKDILASRVLPHLVPLTVEASLNLTQFSAYMSLVQEMLRQALVPATGSGQPSIMDSFMSGLGPMQQQRATNGSSGGGGGGSGRLALPSNVPTTAATPATPLSLEDKRRLAREQEAVDTMRSHGPLRPQANQQQQQMRAIEAPKDLT
uniref:Protein kinase domain-containing protein n=1 Tax=Macrostomum lignano TaxID=282301 RepID=A0A1I8GPZ6_9PLAT